MNSAIVARATKPEDPAGAAPWQGTEVLVDTGAFSLGGPVKWCLLGRRRASGAEYVQVPGCGYVRCDPEQILARRHIYLTREEVADRLGVTLADVARILEQTRGEYRCGWTRGRRTLRAARFEEWAATVKPLIHRPHLGGDV